MNIKKIGFLGVAFFFVAASTAQAKIPRALWGKVFFTTNKIVDQSPEALAQKFKGASPNITLTRGKDGHWSVTVVAFFRKPSHPGPMTFWFYDKNDKGAVKAKEPCHASSVPSSPGSVFVYDLDINPDFGFNKGYSYLVHVGQIIKKRNVVYARGQFSLQK